ncbi:MAG: proton-conducting transporter membrane subunit [Candidatus Methanomethylophilaceae archaeon]
MIATIMVLVPLLAGVLCLLPLGTKGLFRISIAGALASLATAVYCCISPITGTVIDTSIWYIDSLSAFFLLISGFVSFVTLLYSKDYLRTEWEEGRLNAKEMRWFYLTMFVFVSTILLTFAVRSAALTWIGIGATTLVSAFLVGMYKDESATEAAWKYILLCSVGITLALFGIALLYAASSGVIPGDGSLDWPALVADAADLNPVFMKFAAIFFIIGLGTKAGLAPLHNWLPDAHSQAPSPVSGMMSGVLLNCAMYGIMRFYTVSEIVNPGFASNVLLFFGISSLLVAAAFILISKDFKRMLAYSSVENMGLIAIGLGIGTPLALFGAMFQVLAHSICKPLIFFCAGNITQIYKTRTMSLIRGVTEKMRFTGFATVAAGLAIAGAPPFPLFVGELLIISGAIGAGMYVLAGLLALILVFVFAGLVLNIFPMLSGTTDREVSEPVSLLRKGSLALLIVAALFFGLFMPEMVRDVFDGMVLILSGGTI